MLQLARDGAHDAQLFDFALWRFVKGSGCAVGASMIFFSLVGITAQGYPSLLSKLSKIRLMCTAVGVRNYVQVQRT